MLYQSLTPVWCRQVSCQYLVFNHPVLSLQGGHVLTPLPAATSLKPGSAVSDNISFNTSFLTLLTVLNTPVYFLSWVSLPQIMLMREGQTSECEKRSISVLNLFSLHSFPFGRSMCRLWSWSWWESDAEAMRELFNERKPLSHIESTFHISDLSFLRGRADNPQRTWRGAAGRGWGLSRKLQFNSTQLYSSLEGLRCAAARHTDQQIHTVGWR